MVTLYIFSAKSLILGQNFDTLCQFEGWSQYQKVDMIPEKG